MQGIKNVKISQHETLALTKTQAHGGDKRWKASHLPEGAQIKFADVFTRRLREFTGTLKPWANPTVAEVQGLVDEVYGTGTFEVKQNDVWMGLACFLFTI